MKRVLEPEFMDDPIQVKAYSDADFTSSDNLFVQDLKKHLDSLKKPITKASVILDLGCGPGNITEKVSQQWPEAIVIGIDGSKAMIDEAMRRKLQLPSNSSLKNLHYCCTDIASFAQKVMPFSFGFDVIISNSLMHHLPEINILWEAIPKLALPGALHFHRDLRRPISRAQSVNLQKKYLPKAPSVLVNDYLASLNASFSVIEIKNQLISLGVDFLHVYEKGDRYLEVVGISD